MPEGDTIFRTAATLRPVIEGTTIAAARLRDRQFDPERLVGAAIVRVEPRGKHLLMHLSTIDCLHSHLGMTGSWHAYRPGQAWRKPAHYAALHLDLTSAEVICFSPKLLELLSADQLRRHPHLRQLGPDLLSPAWDAASALARLRRRDATPLGVAIMDQSLVAGIGNVYKSELLFLERFDPLAPVACYSDEELLGLLDRAQRLMSRNVGRGPRQTRFRGDGRRVWVYGRSGEGCYRCGNAIQLRRQGMQGRTTYWCPSCQPQRTAPNAPASPGLPPLP